MLSLAFAATLAAAEWLFTDTKGPYVGTLYDGDRSESGGLRALRLDLPNPTCAGDRLILSRVGLFSTVAEATAFLAAAKERPDSRTDIDIAGPRFRAVLSGGDVPANFDRNAYSLAAGPVPAGEGVLAVTCDGKMVPSEVNSRGFAWYVAEKPGARPPGAAAGPRRRPPTDRAS